LAWLAAVGLEQCVEAAVCTLFFNNFAEGRAQVAMTTNNRKTKNNFIGKLGRELDQ
jgi:hypothetical protein